MQRIFSSFSFSSKQQIEVKKIQKKHPIPNRKAGRKGNVTNTFLFLFFFFSSKRQMEVCYYPGVSYGARVVRWGSRVQLVLIHMWVVRAGLAAA